jgi:type I restriction enzyme R subunit
MNEAETRADHIDPALEAAGWGRVEGSRIRREYPITLGRIEGRGRLTLRFAYATNGQGIYGIDLVSGTEGELDHYPTPDELWNRTFAARNAWRDRFSEVQFPDKSGTWTIRYYQEIAVHRVLEALGDGKKRILLTLATGTGKTAIAFQIAWKLFQSRWTLGDWKQGGEPSRRPRILFLADRNNLADQAFNDFSSFSAFSDDALRRIDPDSIRRRGRVPTNGSIFFTIFQTFMGGPPKNGRPSPFFGEYPPDFFDFIIIDECHRGGANDEGTWRGIMEYFSPAVQLGLTATPKRRDNADTYAYFGKPVYVYMPDDTLIEGEIETGKRYEEPDFNKIVEIREREKKRVEIFMSHIDQGEKTLVFCATQDQAFGGTRPRQPDQDQPRTELLPKGHGQRRGPRRPAPARFPGQREDRPHHPHHLAEALHRRGRPQQPRHRPDAPHQFDDRVQADHRPMYDAELDLGKPAEIGKVFAGFQKYLYQRREEVA